MRGPSIHKEGHRAFHGWGRVTHKCSPLIPWLGGVASQGEALGGGNRSGRGNAPAKAPGEHRKAQGNRRRCGPSGRAERRAFSGAKQWPCAAQRTGACQSGGMCEECDGKGCGGGEEARRDALQRGLWWSPFLHHPPPPTPFDGRPCPPPPPPRRAILRSPGRGCLATWTPPALRHTASGNGRARSALTWALGVSSRAGPFVLWRRGCLAPKAWGHKLWPTEVLSTTNPPPPPTHTCVVNMISATWGSL